MPKLKIEHDTETSMTTVSVDDEKLGLIQEISFRHKAEDLAPEVDISMMTLGPGDDVSTQMANSAIKKVKSLLDHMGRDMNHLPAFNGEIGISSSRKLIYRDNSDGSRSVWSDSKPPVELCRYQPVDEPEEESTAYDDSRFGPFKPWDPETHGKYVRKAEDGELPPSTRTG